MVNEALRVNMASDGFYPRALRWQGRVVRILGLDEVYTCGSERRYRLRTPEGAYELAVDVGVGTWQVRRAPNWWQRFWAGVQRMPRYPLPAGRRRGPRGQARQAEAVRRRPAPTPVLARASAG